MAHSLKEANYSQAISSRKAYLRKETTTLVLAFLLIIVVAVLSQYVLARIESQRRQDIAGTLKVSLLTVQEALDIWAYERKTDALEWGLNKHLQSAVRELLAISHDRETLLTAPASSAIDHLLDRSINDYRYIGYTIVASNNFVIASNFKSNIGTSPSFLKETGFLPEVFKGKSILSQPFWTDDFSSPASVGFTKEKMAVFSAAPIRNNQGEIIAALIFLIDPSRDFSRITPLGRLEETGEVFAFDRKARMLTASRFHNELRQIGLVPPGELSDMFSLEIRDPGGNMPEGFRPSVPLAQRPLTKMAKEALSGKPGMDLDGYPDYRGVLVVSSWIWDNNLGFGLVTKIDKAEAFKSFRLTRILTLFTVGATVFLFFGLTVFHIVGSRRRLALIENIRDKETHMSTVVDSIMDGIVTLNTQGVIDSFNPAAETIFGYKSGEITGHKLSALIPELDSHHIGNHIQNYLRTGKNKSADLGRELSGQRKDGSVFPLNLAVSTMVLSGESRFVGIIRDITEQKNAELALRESEQRLRQLAIHLQAGQEEERERLCREIHDELGQSLTVIKMNLSWMNKKLPPESADLSNMAQSMVKLADDTIDSMRRIAAGLRPRVLDDLGLIAAIEWHSNEFQGQTGIKCIFNCDLHCDLDRELSITVFRIYQEAMTNVLRHAKAHNVVITLKDLGAEISLVIRDNGVGIAEDRIAGSNSLGILGMNERAHLWGGKLDISSHPGKGTTVSASIPIQKKIERRAQL